MKKFVAILLALLVVFSTSAVAFAADIYTCPECGKKYDSVDAYNDCIDKHASPETEQAEEIYECGTCHKKYKDIEEYNACVDTHFNNVNHHYDKYVDLTVVELLNAFVDMFNNIGAKELFVSVFEKVFTIFETIISGDFVKVEA